MAAVKSLVVFMSLLLLLGLGLLGYGMMQKSRDLREATSAEAPAFGPVGLDEPAGTSLTHFAGDGQGRLLLGLTGGGRPDRVVVVDGASGRRLGTLSLGPGPTPRAER
jgi:hypothetical protein